MGAGQWRGAQLQHSGGRLTTEGPAPTEQSRHLHAENWPRPLPICMATQEAGDSLRGQPLPECRGKHPAHGVKPVTRQGHPRHPAVAWGPSKVSVVSGAREPARTPAEPLSTGAGGLGGFTERKLRRRRQVYLRAPLLLCGSPSPAETPRGQRGPIPARTARSQAWTRKPRTLSQSEAASRLTSCSPSTSVSERQ